MTSQKHDIKLSVYTVSNTFDIDSYVIVVKLLIVIIVIQKDSVGL